MTLSHGKFLTSAVTMSLAASALQAQEQTEPQVLRFMDGNALYAECTSRTDDGDARRASEITCISYILGIVDLHEAQVALGLTNREFCLHEDVTSYQLVDFVVEYLRANPDQRRLPAAFSALIALKQALPCSS